MNLIIYILFILTICITVFRYATLKNSENNNNEQEFFRVLKESKRRLVNSVNDFSHCIKHSSIKNCMKENDEIYKFKKETHSNHLTSFNNLNDYKILIQPELKNDIRNVVIIPIAPTELIARTAIRSTWKTITSTKVRNLHYMFFMGKPQNSNYNNSYPLSLINEEAKIYKDVLLLDVENSYVKCILLLLLCFKFVLENFPSLEFLIRVNSDMIFLPNRLDKMLELNENAIGYETEQIGIKYLSGSFYCIKKEYINIILRESKITIPIVFYDDIYFGQINAKIKYKRIALINDYDYYLPVYDYNQNKLFNKSAFLIGAHSVNSNAMLYLWKYFGYKIIL